jgi:hypothetical protein
MKNITKGLLATTAAGAMAMTSAAPAVAQSHRNNDRIDAGDIIAGAAILGGIAVLASAVGGRDRNSYRGRNYDNRDGYRGGYRGDRRGDRRSGNPRRAVERCVRAAERDARRYGYRYADVTQIRDVDRTRYGFRVKGRIIVDGARGYRNSNYDRNYRGFRNSNYRGDNYRGDRRSRADRGKFTCFVERGRVAGINYRGIRGLR